MALENQEILSHREGSSTYGRGWWPLMHTLAKLRRFWMGDSFLWKANLQKLQPLLEHEQLQDSSILAYDFGMGYVKGEGNNMRGVLHCKPAVLS